MGRECKMRKSSVAMRMIRKTAVLGAAALLTLSCAKDINERTIHEGSGIGFPQKVYDLNADAGQLAVPVIATREFTVTADASWITVPQTAPAGREGFLARYTANTSLPRAAQVIVAIDDHRDTVTLRQHGAIAPELAATSNVIAVKGSADGKCEVLLQTNLPVEDLLLSWDSDGSESWIDGVKVEGKKLVFNYKANPLSHTRHGSINVSYTDAFGNVLMIPFQVSQLSNADSAGEALSLQEFCALATEEGTEIENDVVIEGIVVSDKENGNCGDNTQLSVTSIDYTMCRRTIYLEALDGSMGICLVTKTDDDNVFAQGDRVKFSVRGTVLTKSRVIDPETDPVFFTLTGLKGNMAIESEALGREGIPVKEKYIGAITDEDIFTYITVKDCELPVRKGPLTPVSETFTSGTGVDKVAKFGILLHDICGGSMYLYTNTTCPYRRDGSALPQGSGKVSGVVVHELYPRFSYQDNDSPDSDTWGNIGRYQLRHTTKDDFHLAKTMEDGTFSAILCEWSSIREKNQMRYYATAGDPNAYFDYSFVYPDSYTDGRAGTLPINKMTDYSYLGPLDSEHPDGKIASEEGQAWSTNLTVRDGAPMYTSFVFSTAGISSTRMSMQISSMNYFYSSTQKIGGVPMYLEGPRYWWVEYSLDGSEWTPVAKYSLPEFCQTSPITQLWQTAGYKPVNVPLPASKLLGKEKVWIRIIPDAEMQTGSQTAYLEPSIVYPNSGSFPTAWNYIGIRYNTVDPPATEFGGGSDIDGMDPIDYNW